jgi:hypothetical protein
MLLEIMVRKFDLENKRKSSQKKNNDNFHFLGVLLFILNQRKKQPLMITFLFLVFLLFFNTDHPFVLDRHGYEDTSMPRAKQEKH